jgi:hypothetical protein
MLNKEEYELELKELVNTAYKKNPKRYKNYADGLGIS